MHRLIIFASGHGSNATAIIEYFRGRQDVSVALIVTNKADAGVLQTAAANNIESRIITTAQLNDELFSEQLKKYDPALIILAGFLKKIPAHLIATFPQRIINIHPALLPKYGGKGMYGHHVHEAVVRAGEPQSGITIHQVDEVYDNGATLLQAYCPLLSGDDAQSLAARVLQLEHFYYPRTVEFLLSTL